MIEGVLAILITVVSLQLVRTSRRLNRVESTLQSVADVVAMTGGTDESGESDAVAEKVGTGPDVTAGEVTLGAIPLRDRKIALIRMLRSNDNLTFAQFNRMLRLVPPRDRSAALDAFTRIEG